MNKEVNYIYEADSLNLNFCDENWPEIISKTQTGLIDSEFLFEFAKMSKMKFNDDTQSAYCEKIPKTQLRTPVAHKLDGVRAGYDLPCSFTPDNWNGKYIALCFQDPLRNKKEPDHFSIGIPFGLSSASMRNKARYKFVWRLVLELAKTGFGIWLTDANKIWIEKEAKSSNFTIDEIDGLNQLQLETLKAEIGTVDPVLTIAFGIAAQTAFHNCGFDYSKHPHPGVFGGKPLIDAYQLSKGSFDYNSRFDAAWRKVQQSLQKVTH